MKIYIENKIGKQYFKDARIIAQLLHIFSDKYAIILKNPKPYIIIEEMYFLTINFEQSR